MTFAGSDDLIAIIGMHEAAERGRIETFTFSDQTVNYQKLESEAAIAQKSAAQLISSMASFGTDASGQITLTASNDEQNLNKTLLTASA